MDNRAPEAPVDPQPDRQAGPVQHGPRPEEGASPEGAPPSSGPSHAGHPPDSVADDSAAPHPAEEEGAEAEGDDKDIPKSSAAQRIVIKRLTKERDEYLDHLRRTKAEFDNYRKRMLRQQSEHLERAAESLVEKLLPVLDNFDAAVAHGQGFEQVHTSLLSALAKEGLERIHPEGKPFDPVESDAVAHEDGTDGPVVAEVLRAGYRWKGRVMRPAMVRVRG